MSNLHVCEIERDSERQLSTAKRQMLAAALLEDPRVVGAWLALENDGLKGANRLERLQVCVAADSQSAVDEVILPIVMAFGRRHRMRLYWSHSGNPEPDIYPRDIMERLRKRYTWNRYVTLGEVFKLPPKVNPADLQ